jgi:hypothetical protein
VQRIIRIISLNQLVEDNILENIQLENYTKIILEEQEDKDKLRELMGEWE